MRKALKRLEEYGLISPQTEKKKGLRKMRYLVTGANLLRECALETTVDHQVLADLASHHAFRYGTKIESLLKGGRKENKEALSPKLLDSTLYTTGLITLAALNIETPLSTADLAARTGISHATIRQKVKALEALGLANIQKACPEGGGVGRRQVVQVVSLSADWRDFFLLLTSVAVS